MTNSNSIKLIRKAIDLAPGTHRGLWSADTVTLENGVKLETEDGFYRRHGTRHRHRR